MASSAAVAVAAAARSRGRTAATSASPAAAAASPAATASCASPATPPMRFAAISAISVATGRSGWRAERLAGRGDHRGHPLEAAGHRRQPHVERRELPGEQRVERAADHVDPHERVPRLLAQVLLVEPELGQLAQHQVTVDPVAGIERRVVEARELRLPAVDEREARLAAGLGEVRPAIVEAVVADARRDVGLEHEQLVEEAADEVVERGHGHLR